MVCLANDLDAILDNPKLAGAVVSCTVADEAGTVIYERNPAVRVMPGSNQKLLSNSFALYKLGPGYQPETRIWNLRDRIIVDAPGDPMMTHERLQKAAAMLHLNGRKPVCVREAYRPLIGPSWEWDDLPNKYAAPVTAFTVDRGSIELWGSGDKLWITPRFYWIHPTRGARSGSRRVTYDPVRRTLSVEGEIPKDGTRLDTLALDRPDEAAAMYLGRGFRLIDKVPERKPDMILGGPPLSQMLKECLVHSDNNIAENLLLMAASKDKLPGTDPYKDAGGALLQFMENVVGADRGDFHPEDGSGMSRHDLVTTRGIVKLLQWAAKQPTKDIWLDALVKPGAGTLGERLRDVPFVGKTGTLDLVVALSGYVNTKKSRTLAVSLILNHFVCGERDARSIADDFMKKLAEDDGIGTKPAHTRLHEARSPLARTVGSDVGRHR